ncbi:hypothetical protein RRG08_022939 [Elysia crispata]|uniref:Uncharacterized protein n=1 Tax=Elysia crispata TaxID=231223 RepID=A0AAE0XNV5_9GAST|nr:hypothetical protein RRG08_022939 [Elysia crispata]
MTLTKNKDGLWLIAMMESNPLDNDRILEHKGPVLTRMTKVSDHEGKVISGPKRWTCTQDETWTHKDEESSGPKDVRPRQRTSMDKGTDSSRQWLKST